MNPVIRIGLVLARTNLAAAAHGLVYAALVIGDRFPEELLRFTVLWGVTAAGASVPTGSTIYLIQTRRLRSALRDSAPIDDHARRDALNMPLRSFVRSLVIWIVFVSTYPLAARIAGVSVPAEILEHMIVAGLLAGTAAAILVFYRTEQTCAAEIVPRLIPDGRISIVPGVWGTPVWLRIVVLVVSCVLVPLGACAILVSTGDVGAAPILYLIAASLILAILQTRFVLGAVAGPIGRLRDRMADVRRGDLTVSLPVGSADSLGQMSESFNEMVAGLRERELIRDTFGRYVPPEVAREILERRLELGGEQREATVLFADLVGFTTLAERLRPAEVVRLLNSYLEVAVGVLLAHRGTLDKFIGDAVMAVFGVPIDDRDHPQQAARAALELLAQVHTWNRAHPEWPDLEVAVGIHTGEVVAGNVGTAERMQYTVVGDAVNVASRLERLCRTFDRPILVGETTAGALGETFALAPIGEEALRGKTRPVRVYALLGENGIRPADDRARPTDRVSSERQRPGGR